MRFVMTTNSSDWPRPFSWIKLGGHAYSRVDTVDALPCADVSVQSVVAEMIRGSRCAALPDAFQFVRQSYWLTYSGLNITNDKVI